MKPTDVNLVIYHKGCTDGFGSAWAAWTILGDRAEYLAADFDDPPPVEQVKGKCVLIVDFSYPLESLLTLKQSAADLILLDHHKSAQTALDHLDFTYFDMNESGATLAWQYFHPDEACPKFVQLIADRDLWQFRLPRSKEFSAAFLNVPFDFQAFNQYLDEKKVQETMKEGAVLLSYIDSQVRRMAKRAGRWLLDQGPKTLRVAVLNSPMWMSELGHALAEQPDADFGLIWYQDFKSGFYKCSLRSLDDKADVSAVAAGFGGGGHKCASAFTCRQHPQTLFLHEVVSHPNQTA